MADTPAPDGTRRSEAISGLRSQPVDAGANPPVAKMPAPAPAAGAASRPGAAPAGTPALAAERAAQVAANYEPEEPRGLSTDQVMPTCMIYAMFAGLAVMLGTMLCWMLNALGPLLQRLH